MRVIIAGNRDHNNYEDLLTAIKESGFDIDMIVSGGARGVDHLGEHYAREHGLPCQVFKAQWGEHGRAAGPIIQTEYVTAGERNSRAGYPYRSAQVRDRAGEAGKRHKEEVVNIEEPRFCCRCAAGLAEAEYLGAEDQYVADHVWLVDCDECGWSATVYQYEETS